MIGQPQLVNFILKPDFKTYYNINTPLSYDNIYLYLLLGARGMGKTTGVLWYCINRFKKNGEEFAYIRRYKSELKKSKSVLNKICGGVSTKGLGDGAFEFHINRRRAGFGLALSVQQSLKSGIDGSNVTNIVFDEGILMRGGLYRYLDNEVHMLFELISTIVRDRKNYKIWIIGNNLDIFNPYYSFFNIPRFEGKIIFKDRGIYCEELPMSNALYEKEKETPLFNITKGTQYHDYHYKNKLLVTNTYVVEPKPKDAKLLLRIVYNEMTLNLYVIQGLKLYVEHRNKVINDNITFIIMEKDKPNYYYAKMYRDCETKRFIDLAYYNNDVIYNNDKAYGLMDLFMETI